MYLPDTTLSQVAPDRNIVVHVAVVVISSLMRSGWAEMCKPLQTVACGRDSTVYSYRSIFIIGDHFPWLR